MAGQMCASFYGPFRCSPRLPAEATWAAPSSVTWLNQPLRKGLHPTAFRAGECLTRQLPFPVPAVPVASLRLRECPATLALRPSDSAVIELMLLCVSVCTHLHVFFFLLILF